jgi:hypothetical protein
MISLTERLRPNSEEVAAKVMDGEAIMINLSNGMYYSMDQVGGVIWELIVDGLSLEEIAASIVKRYDVEPSQAQADIQRLAADLIEEKLVTIASGEAPHSPTPSNGVSSGQKLAYESPQLNAYRDMGDLLALDPPMPGLADIPWQSEADRTSR